MICRLTSRMLSQSLTHMSCCLLLESKPEQEHTRAADWGVAFKAPLICLVQVTTAFSSRCKASLFLLAPGTAAGPLSSFCSASPLVAGRGSSVCPLVWPIATKAAGRHQSCQHWLSPAHYEILKYCRSASLSTSRVQAKVLEDLRVRCAAVTMRIAPCT